MREIVLLRIKSGRRGYAGPIPRIRLAVLPRWWRARYSWKTTLRFPLTIAFSAFTTTISSPLRSRFAGRRPIGRRRDRSHRLSPSSPHDPDAGSFRVLEGEFEEGDRPTPGGFDLLLGGGGRPECRDGHRSLDLPGGQHDARDDDLLALRRVPAEAGEVDLRPVLARSLEALRDIPPDRRVHLAGDRPELPDDLREVRVRFGDLGA